MTKGRLVVRLTRLEALDNFLTHVTAEAAHELEEIERRGEKGEFETFEDLEYVESAPFSRIEIASRAIAQELVNLVESELQALARLPWLYSNHKGPKTLIDLEEEDDVCRLRMVSDLPIRGIIDLIDSYYGISVEQIQGWDGVSRLRSVANDLKHRYGWKHWRECFSGTEGFRFPQAVQITSDDAYAAIETIRQFLAELDKATELSNNGD